MKRQGYALLVVVAVLGALSVAAGVAALAAQTSTAGARADLDQARYRAAIEAGAARAAIGLSRDAENEPWIADGRAYRFELDGLDVTIRPLAESGRFDLNQGDSETLQRLLVALDIDRRDALTISGALPDWRDGDDDRSQNGAEAPAYRSSGTPPPANRPFLAVEEFRRVLGVTADIYEAAVPYLTIDGTQSVAAHYAPPTLLASLDRPGGDAQRILAARQSGGALAEVDDGGETGNRYAIFVEVESPSGGALARIITVILPGENGVMDVLRRTPVAVGEAQRFLEPDAN